MYLSAMIMYLSAKVNPVNSLKPLLSLTFRETPKRLRVIKILLRVSKRDKLSFTVVYPFSMDTSVALYEPLKEDSSLHYQELGR